MVYDPAHKDALQQATLSNQLHLFEAWVNGATIEYRYYDDPQAPLWKKTRKYGGPVVLEYPMFLPGSVYRIAERAKSTMEPSGSYE